MRRLAFIRSPTPVPPPPPTPPPQSALASDAAAAADAPLAAAVALWAAALSALLTATATATAATATAVRSNGSDIRDRAADAATSSTIDSAWAALRDATAQIANALTPSDPANPARRRLCGEQLLDAALAPLDDLPAHDTSRRYWLARALHLGFTAGVWTATTGDTVTSTSESDPVALALFEASWGRLLVGSVAAGIASDPAVAAGAIVATRAASPAPRVIVGELVAGCVRRLARSESEAVFEAIFERLAIARSWLSGTGGAPLPTSRSDAAAAAAGARQPLTVAFEGVFASAAEAAPEVALLCIGRWIKVPERRYWALQLLGRLCRLIRATDLARLDETGVLEALLEVVRFDAAIATTVSATSLLATLIPYCAANLSISRLEDIVAGLLRVIRWEPIACLALKFELTPGDGRSDVADGSDPDEEDLEMEDMDAATASLASRASSPDRGRRGATRGVQRTLSALSVSSVHAAIELLFTVAYGIAPRLLATRGREFVLAARIGGASWHGDDADGGIPLELGGPMPPSAEPAFLPLSDPGFAARLADAGDILEAIDLGRIIARRFESLLSSHRLHPGLVLNGSAEEEVSSLRALANRGHAEVLDFCLSLRAAPTEFRGPTRTPPDDVEDASLRSYLSSATRANMDLRERLGALAPGEIDSLELPIGASQRRPASADTPGALLGVQFLLMLNELNVEKCLRAEQQAVFGSLRRTRLVDDIRAVNQDTMYHKVGQLQKELLDRQRSEAQERASTERARDIMRRQMDSLNRRINTAREANIVAAAETAAARQEAESCHGELRRLRADLAARDARVGVLQLEVRAHADAEASAAENVHVLTERLRAMETTVERTDGVRPGSQAESLLFEAEMRSGAADLEISKLVKENESLRADLLATSSTQATLEEQTKTLEGLRRALAEAHESGARRVEALEAKCQTLRNINIALEARYLEDESAQETSDCAGRQDEDAAEPTQSSHEDVPDPSPATVGGDSGTPLPSEDAVGPADSS
ncbi:hypothetical protein HK405_004271 [Cladochytrium tenue]|nr:hypothetical protein HK405_004271 [Cladochytrium tenue]